MKTKVTRRTILGYAVNTSPTQDNPGYHFELPTTPGWVGTIKTISEAISGDRLLNSLTNTFHSSAWFVKVKGTWMRVTEWEAFGWAMDELTTRRDDPWNKSYLKDEVEVEVDYPTETARAAAQLGKAKKGDTSRENGKKGGRPKGNSNE
jgi:hypothetical protein